MTYDRPPVYVPATPKFILEVIRDSHRQQCQFDPEADPSAEFSFETTTGDWRSACDLVDAKGLGRALNQEFGLNFPDDVWHGVLEPPWERELRGVCELIASQAERPTIKPVTILGSTCLPAGAFLAIRFLLKEAGADVSTVAPSTPLANYTRSFLGVFLGPVSRLAPNALPDVRVWTPWYDLSIIGFSFGLLLFGGSAMLTALWAKAGWAMAGGAILAVSSWAGTWIAGRYLPPASVEFGTLRTFRDMAECVAEGVQPTSGILPH